MIKVVFDFDNSLIEVGHDENEEQNASGEQENNEQPAENEAEQNIEENFVPDQEPEHEAAEPEQVPGQVPEQEEHEQPPTQEAEQAENEPQNEPQNEEHPAENEEHPVENEEHPVKNEEEKPKEEELKLEDLEEVVKIYDAYRSMMKKVEPENDKVLEKEFEQKMSEMANELKNALAENKSAELSNACILKARHDVLDVTFDKMVQNTTDKLSQDLWKSIRNEHNSIVSGLLAIIAKMKTGPKESAEGEVAQAQKETHDVLEAAKNLESEMQKHIQEKESLKRQFEEEKKDLLSQITSLEEENKRYLDTIIKRSKMAGVPTPSIGGNSPSKDLNKESRKMIKALPTGIVGPTQVRTLTLKQLKDLIQDMYLQKQKYDEKCAESRLPRETMEQYMYTYLNQRYGLKNLIIEWAAAIINGIKRYSLEDSDVALFGKILRNECDEDFRFVHNEVKSAMTDILREKLKRKYRHRTESDIAKLLNDVQAGEIEEWQWKEIIKKMYNEDHFAILEQRIRDKISERNPQIGKADRRRLTREELIALQNQKEKTIPFADFQKIVLDFQLATHEKYIKKFVTLFKKLDTDTNGILSEEEFKQLIAMMKVTSSEEDVERLLQIVDPYNNQQVTFSECLALLSSVFS